MEAGAESGTGGRTDGSRTPVLLVHYLLDLDALRCFNYSKQHRVPALDPGLDNSELHRPGSRYRLNWGGRNWLEAGNQNI